MLYSMEIIPEIIWANNKRLREENRIKRSQDYRDIILFCIDNDLGYIFGLEEKTRCEPLCIIEAFDV